jgi:hypothetical protein
MSYFERCKKRIENSKFLSKDFNNSTIEYFIDEYLAIAKFFVTNTYCRYNVTYKHATVPLSENEKQVLFNMCEEIHSTREDARVKKILQEL